MKIAFSTLSCPDWSWERILDEASRLGYDGIELRGIQGELYMPKCPPFQPENIEKTMMQISGKGLKVCCIDTSCAFHDPLTYEASIQEGMSSIDLAQKLRVPFIRVFGNNIPDVSRKEETIRQVAEALERLGKYAEDKKVEVLLETHGDFSSSESVLSVLAQTSSRAIGVLWDINNSYKSAGETLEETYRALEKNIKHLHIKDTSGTGKNQKPRLVGQGDLPVQDCLNLLTNKGYQGWLVFEWEKKWHPAIDEPEVALPSFVEYMRSINYEE